MQNIYITSISSISALGVDSQSIWEQYLNKNHLFSRSDSLDSNWICSLEQTAKDVISNLKKSDLKYKNLDDSVLFAIAASRGAIAKTGWNNDHKFGINVGSSRGATTLFEKHYKDFLDSGKAQTLASPTTTLGNISSWVSHDLQSDGPEISHSITCSTSLHAMLNGIAWLRAGMAKRFLVGGSEAPLTLFTIAQMQAMKIYANNDFDYPCRALDFEKTKNTMILGEAAAICCLETERANHAIAKIDGVGYATELLAHNTSISAEATCFQKSMTMALENQNSETIDAVVMHAPGTIKGDLAEFNAIQKIFKNKMPLLTTNKWKIGHTFGASGLMSVEFAILMLQNQTFVGTPFHDNFVQKTILKKIMVNSVGFGGNAVSVVIALPD